MIHVRSDIRDKLFAPTDVLHLRARGVEALMGTDQFLDLAPLGRNEGELEFRQAWWRRHDEYED